MDLCDLVDRVVDRKTFFEFLSALIADREDEVEKEKRNPSSPFSPGVNGWENGSIETFLDAALAWAHDNGLSEEPSWRTFAQILHAGKFYE